MTRLGFPLIVAGFLLATYQASLDPLEINWMLFLPAIAIGAAGVALVRHGRHSAARQSHVLEGNRAALREGLGRLVRELEAFSAAKETIATDDLRHEVDRRFREDLRAFADARESLTHLYGLKAYAQVMSSFAAGERYLNRVWSASTDGYGDEARTYVDKALEQFREAQRDLEALAG